MSHDSCVGVWAEAFTLAGWDVYAVLSGNPEPLSIHGKIPDIYAWTCNHEMVVEVETNKSIGAKQSIERVAVFRDWASESSTRSFKLLLAYSRGCTVKE